MRTTPAATPTAGPPLTSEEAARPLPAALVNATDVTKAHRVGKRSIEILHGISMEVRPGEMCAVMGPSGSGKSTLLYCLAGLEQATTGDVALLGQSTRRLSGSKMAKLRRTSVGFVFQSYNLVPSLTAYENVALPIRFRGERPDRDLIVAALTSVGLGEHIASRPAVMSGGEQQRVALARVLAQQPQIIFADEPTGALDTRSGEVVLEELRKIAHEPGRSVLTVTHDPLVAARCDRVLFLRDGYLVREVAHPSVDDVTQTLADITTAESVVR